MSKTDLILNLINKAAIFGRTKAKACHCKSLASQHTDICFDEVTSNIDAESENDIMTVIHNMAKIKTVILISHRLENVVGSDKILLLDKGKIEESGTHSELMSLNKNTS